MTLRQAYEQYVEAWSNPVFAISWEAAVYLHILAKIRRPANILDLGSGFSSYVLRLDGRTVYTVDSDENWLARTNQFLEHNKIRNDRMYTWEEFVAQDLPAFDLISYDYNGMNGRYKKLPFVLTLLGADGVMYLDDMQFSDYATAVADIMQPDFEIISKRDRTLDNWGRYGALVRRRHDESM